MREELQKDQSVIRITGLSGLGKTRLALEALKSPAQESEIAQGALSARVLYFDAAFGEQGLVNFLSDMRNMEARGILVVDNCESTLHKRLCKEIRIRGSKLNLVTLDYNPEEPSSDYCSICLKREDCEGVVGGIIRAAYPGLGEPTIQRIVEFALNFPKIAVMLAKQVDRGVDGIGRISDKELVKKLILGRGPHDQDTIAVIEACSLVEYFEFSEGSTQHTAFLAEEIAGVTKQKFYETCIEFKKRGILEQRGRFLRVSPIPLAITLAAEWWQKILPDRAKEIINEVSKVGLAEQFCDQISKLHFSAKAQKLTEELCSIQGPFGSAEVLNSEEGSRLFRSLVEVSPQATVDALDRVFGKWKRDNLLKVGPGRRSLIWALEKLCWWRETFSRAARLTLSFAAAENEEWSNNATGQFKQLFQIYLSGTQANLNERLQIAYEALNSEVKEERELGIRALGRAIETNSFSRSGGVESQGSRIPGRDYEPNGKEIREYRRECIGLLKSVIVADGELSSLARQELGTELRGLLRNGMIDEIEAALKDIVKERGAYWPEALKSIRYCIDYDGVDMPTEIRERIDYLEHILQPEDLGKKLHLIVSIPDWRDRKDEKGDYVSISAEEADKLAHQLAGDDTWFKEVQVILEGEQRQASAFGRALGQSMPGGLRKDFTEVCLSILAELGREKGNPDVLGAFLGNVSDEELVDETMGKVVQDEKLWGYAVWLTRFLELTEKHLLRLLPLVDQNKIPISDIRVFGYGKALDKLSEKFVVEFCQTSANHSQEGANCALDVMYMYCYQNDERFTKCVTTFRNIVMRKGLLVGEKQSQMAGHNWEVVSNKLLRINRDIELAKHLAEQIVVICGSDNVAWNNIRSNAKRVLEVLFKEYFDECWEIISKSLVSEEWQARHHVENIVGPGYEKEKSEALITKIPQEGLLKWCKKNVPYGPATIAHLTPVFASEKGQTSWHPLARKLIDEFGNIEEVRNKLDSNLWSFSSVGSRAPYYQKRIDLLSELSNHPIKEVREWAASSVKYFENEKNTARREAEEREWGIH